MISFAAFKILVYTVFAVAWASVIFILISGAREVGKWFNQGGKKTKS